MKAIIMAGGEGTRLRPLTCDCPKPMIRLMNRPVMEYALRLLRAHGVTDVAATLGYLPDTILDAFGAGDALGVNLRCFVEDVPLGTAGGVKRAEAFLDDTFIVLSGDGVTDLDIGAALAFHRERRALATLVLKRVDDPLEYGVVSTDPEGRVVRFQEKPDWGDVTADTVNTGIYILEPEALSRIPADRPCDFGGELFPALVREGARVYGYVMDGYWCDIGDVRAYLAAHRDAMEGRIRLEGLLPGRGRVMQMPGAQVDRAALLEGPCLIGPGARVEAGACVGPYSVLGAGCAIGAGASVKRAVLWDGAILEPRAQARDCVLGRRAWLGTGAQVYDGCALGTDARVEPRAMLLPGVRLWPGKRAGAGERLDANRVWGEPASPALPGGRMALTTPEQAARFAQALVVALKPGELLLGRGEGGAAQALWHAAAAGAMAQGAAVLDAGPCPLPVLSHACRALRTDAGALVEGDGILPLNADGARLEGGARRSLSALYARQDFAVPFCREAPSARTADGAALAWAADAARGFCADPGQAPRIALHADGPLMLELASMAFSRAGLTVRAEADESRMIPGPGELGVWLTEGGEGFLLADESGMLDDAGRQLLLAWAALQAGERTLLLPAHATRAIEVLARDRGARVEYAAGDGALWMNRLAREHHVQLRMQFDGAAAALAAISALTEAGLTLADWRAGMPDVHRRGRSLSVPMPRTGRILDALARREEGAELGGGLRFRHGDGWAWMCPDPAAGGLRIIAEAATAETAGELCDFCVSEVRKILGS